MPEECGCEVGTIPGRGVPRVSSGRGGSRNKRDGAEGNYPADPGPGAGLTEYAEGYANATDLHTIPKPRLHHRRGRLASAEMASLERAVRTYLGL